MTEEITTTEEGETAPEAPITPPERSVVIQMQFETEGQQADIYNARVDHAYGSQDADFAKGLAEIVERTALLHLGALPVLTKVEAAA